MHELTICAATTRDPGRKIIDIAEIRLKTRRVYVNVGNKQRERI